MSKQRFKAVKDKVVKFASAPRFKWHHCAVWAVSAFWAPIAVAQGVSYVKHADDPGCRTCVQQAASMFARGEAVQAQKLLRGWSPKCQSSAQMHLLFSTTLLSTGSNEEAEKESGLATAIAPSLLAAHLQHAIALQALDRKMQAAAEFERAVEIDPSCYEAWVALSSVYRQLHEDDKALDATAKAADLEPHSKALRMGTLTNLKRAGKFAEARNEIKRLLTASTTTPEFAEDLAREALLVGAYDEAVTGSAKSIEAHPKSAAPLFTNALAHFCQKNYDAAVEDTDKILAIEPQNVDAVAMKALAQTKGNHIDDAEATLKNAGADSNSTIYWLSKGTINQARNNYAVAEEALRACLDYDQGNNAMQGIPHSLAHLQLAEVYKQQGKAALASEQLQAVARDKRFAAEAH
jgi:tetratricopeptide (TPR) repeat protein